MAYTHRLSENNSLIQDDEMLCGRCTDLDADSTNVNKMDDIKDSHKRRKVELYAMDNNEPKLYDIKTNLATPVLLPKNLPAAFDVFPIFGSPKSDQSMDNYEKEKIKEFVGNILEKDEFEVLSKYCSPEHLKTGNEFVMGSPFPAPGITDIETTYLEGYTDKDRSGNHLHVVNRHRVHMENGEQKQYPIKLKYRGLRLMSLGVKNEELSENISNPLNPIPTSGSEVLQPGKDLLYKIRVYRPFFCNLKEVGSPGRPGVLSCEVRMLGRQPLTALRDRFVCYNDLAVRHDMSHAPHCMDSRSTSKELFPSGFLFINNVFYVDSRAGCRDTSAGIRAWLRARHMGEFPARDLNTPLHDVGLRLGYSEVYVHQGKCEHLFTVSEIRLLNHTDPLELSAYPCHTAVSQYHTVYCMTCAQFSAKWLVTGCSKVPFDPAFFCEICFQQYLYKDGTKICDFKAYAFKSNETKMLKT